MIYLDSKEDSETREVKCSECGTINSVPILKIGGTKTIFCKGCGEEITLVFDKTVLGIERSRHTRSK